MLSQAVKELKDKLLTINDISYDSIDRLMRKIMKSKNVTAKELHNAFKNKYKKTPDDWIKEKMKNLKEDHKEIASGKKVDDEGYMARNELDSIERAIKNLRKSIKSGDQQLPAWIQSKITKARDYIDTASEYLESDEEIEESNYPSFYINKDTQAKERKKNILRKKLNDPTQPQEQEVASNIAKKLGGTGVKYNKPKLKEDISLVEKILGEEKCGKGMYWCNTDQVCKPLSKKMKKSVIDEERDPKGPTKSYKSPEEIAKKHKVSLDQINKQLKIGTKVEFEHTTSKSEARITALQHLDELPDYYTRLNKMETQKESFVNESSRIPSQTGINIFVTLSWRGKYYTIQIFFPQSKVPSRIEISDEIQKIYPGSRVITYRVSELKQGEPLIYAFRGGSGGKIGPNKNYVKPMGEEVEITEVKK